MRAFLVFDPTNDLVFRLGNEKFFDHVTSVALRSGLIESAKEAIVADILVHLFAPLLVSQKIYREQQNNPCACIQCDEQTLILFTEYLGYTVIYICKASERRQGTEKRRVNTLLQCVWHLYACALPQLRGDFKLRKARIELLEKVMTQYDDLKRDSVPWLVEAQRYYPHSKDNQKLVEELLTSARHSQQQFALTFSHAMLFIDDDCVLQHQTANALRLTITDSFHLSLVVSSMEMNSHVPVFLSTNFNTAVPYLVFRIDTVCQGTVVLLAELSELTGRSDALYALARHVNHLQGEALRGEPIDSNHLDQQAPLIRSMMSKVYRVMSAKPMTEAEKMALARVELIVRETFDSGLFKDTLSDMPKNKHSNNTFLLNQKLSDLQEKVTAAFSELVLKIAVGYQPDRSVFCFSSPRIVANVKLQLDVDSVFVDFSQLRAFVFINRSENKAIHGFADRRDELVRQALQRAWKKSERIVGQGHNFGFTWSDERFSYRYDIWFENFSGRKVAPIAARKQRLPYPGVGAVNFYGILGEELFEKQAKNICCLELLMVASRDASLVDSVVTQMSSKMWKLISKASEKSNFHVFHN